MYYDFNGEKMDRQSLISILNFNGTNDTIECLDTFFEYELPNNYVVVVWDNSTDQRQKQILIENIKKRNLKSLICEESKYASSNIKEYDLVYVISDNNYGFAKSNNKVFKPFIDKFDYFIMLNNDTEFENNTTKQCVDYLNANNSVGVLTTSIYYYYDKNKIWNAGGRFVFGFRKYYTENYVNRLLKKGTSTKRVDYITGCYMFIRKEIIQKYGLLSEDFFFGEEDYNYCTRLKKEGVNLTVLLDQKLYHKVGSSINSNRNNTKILNTTFIYYLNRFVDMKMFYSKTYWNFWRYISSINCMRMALKLTNNNFKFSKKYVSKINSESKKLNCVSEDYFKYILAKDLRP